MITSEVVGRQRFGVFLRIDTHPDAIGLVEITTLPMDAILPAIGERVVGEVIDHADHHQQIKAKLTPSDEVSCRAEVRAPAPVGVAREDPPGRGAGDAEQHQVAAAGFGDVEEEVAPTVAPLPTR
ncbi:hypothetical protein ABZ721_37620 [Streptomyces sp. NPDC006733]|uniref:hypothetical protein n=1 Tax=Streptomyces sp. NPDC006733 TaxID=3155460 RepID=UPI0033E559D7